MSERTKEKKRKKKEEEILNDNVFFIIYDWRNFVIGGSEIPV